jgi:hypothetical protein
LHEAGKTETMALVAQVATASSDPQTLLTKLMEIRHRSFLSEADQFPLLIKGWEDAVDSALEDGILSEQEERSLVAIANALSLENEDLSHTEAWDRVVKAGTLRDVLQGRLPERITVVNGLPFNMQKGETIVWAFNNVAYYEQRTFTRYEGGSHGVSVRVAKGLYYRVGSFRGQPVKRDQMVALGTGLLGVTDRHLYFVGQSKTFRVKYDKIVSFTPYSDGIGIMRDAQTAKPQVFVTGDGWFTYNLITNLAQAFGDLRR